MGRRFTFQQDSDHKHKAKTMLEWLIQVHLRKLEYGESYFFSCNLFQKVKLSYVLDLLHVK